MLRPPLMSLATVLEWAGMRWRCKADYRQGRWEAKGLLYYSLSKVKISGGTEIRRDIKAGFKGAVNGEYHG